MAVISTLAVNLVARTGAFEKNMNKSRKHASRFSRELKTMAKTAITAFSGLAAIRFFSQSLKLYGEQEASIKSLSDALGLIGKNSDAAMTDMKKFAAGIQKITVYGDEAVLRLMAMGSSMAKLSGTELKNATKAAIGLAAAYKLDVVAAMRLVARARMGDVSTLTRYGIKVDAALNKQEKFNEVLKEGIRGFALAEGEVHTFNGRMEQLKNKIGDVREQIGGKLLPAVLRIVSVLDNFNMTFVDVVAKTLKWVAVITSAIYLAPRIVKAIGLIIKALQGMAEAQATVLGLAGPGGWIILGTGLMVAGASLAVIDELFKDIKTDAEGAAKAIDKTAKALKPVKHPLRGGSYSHLGHLAAAATGQLPEDQSERLAAASAKMRARNMYPWALPPVEHPLRGGGYSRLGGIAAKVSGQLPEDQSERLAAASAKMRARNQTIAIDNSAKALEEYNKTLDRYNKLIDENVAAQIKDYNSVQGRIEAIRQQLRDFGKSAGQLMAESITRVMGYGHKTQVYINSVLNDMKDLDLLKKTEEGALEFKGIMQDVIEQLKTVGMDWVDKLKYRVGQLKGVAEGEKQNLYDMLVQLKERTKVPKVSTEAFTREKGVVGVLERPGLMAIGGGAPMQIEQRQLMELENQSRDIQDIRNSTRQTARHEWR